VLRDKALRELQTLILCAKERAARCPIDLLEEVRSQMKAPNLLRLVGDGDHSLRLTKRGLQAAGETQDNVDRSILDTIGTYVKGDNARLG
jgi:hypothetical protein